MSSFKLFTLTNPKMVKGESKGFLTFILHFAPADLSGKEVCPKRTAGCTAACLNTAGRGGMFKPGGTNTIQQARLRKTKKFFEDRAGFMAELVSEIEKGIKYATKRDLTPVFRLNGTSDLSWEKYEVDGCKNIFERFKDYQFYDYTKVLGRKVQGINNYHLTFSAADGNDADVQKALKAGMNVAMVFDKIPEGAYSAEETDLRFLDPKVGIIALRAKGRARKDTTGFVRRTIPIVAE